VSLAFFFILSGIAEMIDNVLRVRWGHIIDPAWVINQVWRALLGVSPVEGPGAIASAVALVVERIAQAMVCSCRSRFEK